MKHLRSINKLLILRFLSSAMYLTYRESPILSPPYMSTTSLDRITELKAQIATLEKNALSELVEKRNRLSHELATVDGEIARLTGKTVKVSTAKAPKSVGKSPSLQELKEIIAAAPEKTLNIRKGGYDLQNIKTLANANPSLLQLGGKGAWPTVTLLK